MCLQNLNGFLVKSTVVAALGGLLFGFDTAVIAGTTRQLTDLFHLTPASLGWTVASALWGTVFGAMLAGIPGDNPPMTFQERIASERRLDQSPEKTL